LRQLGQKKNHSPARESNPDLPSPLKNFRLSKRVWNDLHCRPSRDVSNACKPNRKDGNLAIRLTGRRKETIRYRESNPRRLGESQTCYLLHHIGQKRPTVLAGDRTLGLPRVKRTICQLSYENDKTLAGFEPAPPKGTDFESVTLTTPSQRRKKNTRCMQIGRSTT
jgi:hypothetical protein